MWAVLGVIGLMMFASAASLKRLALIIVVGVALLWAWVANDNREFHAQQAAYAQAEGVRQVAYQKALETPVCKRLAAMKPDSMTDSDLYIELTQCHY